MSDHIKARITAEDVLANDLGLADEETVARIAEARLRNDPELMRLEDVFGIKRGENEEFDIAEEEVPASIARLLDGQRERQSFAVMVRDLILSNPEGFLSNPDNALVVRDLEGAFEMRKLDAQFEG